MGQKELVKTAVNVEILTVTAVISFEGKIRMLPKKKKGRETDNKTGSKRQ